MVTEGLVSYKGYTFDAVWGLDADNVYLVGPGVVRGAAAGWGSAQTVSDAAPTFAIWASSPSNLYVTLGAAAASSVYRSSGNGSWQTTPQPQRVNALWGAGEDAVYACTQIRLLLSLERPRDLGGRADIDPALMPSEQSCRRQVSSRELCIRQRTSDDC